MSKRFVDTDKFRKPFFRGLPAAYKLFWDYLLCSCDFSGVWIVEMDIAQIYLGKDARVDLRTALRLFNSGKKRIHVLDGGNKWLILDFVEFQYGTLSPTNPAHRGVINRLRHFGIENLEEVQNGPEIELPKGSEGASMGHIGGILPPKDKDKDKDKDKEKDIERDSEPEPEETSDDDGKMDDEEKVEKVLEMYHGICTSLPKVRIVTQARRSHVLVRITEMGGLDGVRRVLERTARSDFLNGRKQGCDFRASFDWIFCCKGNWVKIMEGNYDPVEVKKNDGLAVGQVLEAGDDTKIRKKINF